MQNYGDGMNAAIDVTHEVLETERLVLRAWEMEDLEDFHEYNSIPGVGEMAGWAHHETLAESREVLEKFVEERNSFALVLKENGKAIGSVCIDWLDPDPEFDNLQPIIFGYDLHMDYWARGLMSEAVKAVIGYCFQALNAELLRCIILVDNLRSQRVAEKAGFRFWKEWEFHTSKGTVDTYKIYLLRDPLCRKIQGDCHTSVSAGSQ